MAEKLRTMAPLADLPSLIGKEVDEYVRDDWETLEYSLLQILNDRRVDLRIDNYARDLPEAPLSPD